MTRVPGARQPLDAPRGALLRYPALPLVAAAWATFVWFAAANGGFDRTTWGPGALVMLGALAIAVVAVPWRAAPPLLRTAVAALLLYAAWSYLSITWAAQKADAWDGANRTLLYVMAFALTAFWRPPGRAAAAVIGALSLSFAVVGLVELLRVSGDAHPARFFLDGRFAAPAGYQNANVALWSAAFLPCVTLGARREVAPALRGVLVAAAVVLGGLSILGQSRGWLFAAPLALILFLVLTPARVRTTLTLLLAIAAVAAAGPSLLAVYQSFGRPGFSGKISHAALVLAIAAVAAGAVAALAALADRRTPTTREQRRRAGFVLRAACAAAVVLALAGFVAKEGSPFHALSKGWHQFKTQGQPHTLPSAGGSRFSQSLGSGRYDFWRVAWNRFESAPLAGIGADNFQEAYLARRRTDEEPRYPHSVELRTLSQTGLVGTVLLVVALGAALTAGVLAIRRRRGLGAAAAAAGVAWFGYWLLHGSLDWFWEMPALGAPAFAVLGLAAGLMPRAALRRGRRGRRPLLHGPLAALLLLAGLVPAASIAGPWLAELEWNNAAKVWAQHPASAYHRLDTAAAFNPLATEPKLLAGSIALRLGQNAAAERFFRQALARDPGDVFSHLELGALLVQRGSRTQGLALLDRARLLDPRDDVLASVAADAHRGARVNIASVNESLAQRSLARGR